MTMNIGMKHMNRTIRIFLLAVLCLVMQPTSIQAGKNEGAKRLVSLLTEMHQREEVEPDSFYADVQLLRHEIDACKDESQRAIYQATLARLLSMNVWRAQEYERQTASHPDSLMEWTTREYQEAAARLYTQALQDMPSLHRTSTKPWIPLVRRGRDEGIWGNDMLSVIWNAYRQDVMRDDAVRWHCPESQKAIDVYAAAGLDEAVIRLTLQEWDERFHYQIPIDTLHALRDKYRQSPACALIYLRLADASADSVPQQKAYLEEALKLYPKWHRKNELKNRLLDMQAPILSAQTQSVYYPGVDMEIPLEIRHMKQTTWTLYKLPDDFRQDELQDDLLTYVRKHGQRIHVQVKRLASHGTEEMWKDTLRTTAPDCGQYALVLRGSTEMALQGQVIPCVKPFKVSRLDCFISSLPSDKVRLTVVDGQSGEPQAGVTVEVMTIGRRGNTSTQTHVMTANTDSKGHVQWEQGNKNTQSWQVRISRPGDEALGQIQMSLWGQNRRDENETENIRLYVDRSIYRPGQTVFVGALAYATKGWEGRVLRGKEHTLTLLDANRQVVLSRTLRSDEFGMMSDTLVLPKNALPGNYTLRMGVSSIYLQVEEYRRPTFRVELDRKRAQVADGCITLPLLAERYSGVPEEGARVTGTFRWQNHWRFCRMNRYYGTLSLDTLETDAQGRLVLRIPIPSDAEMLKQGLQASVKVDVLSPTGETQSQEAVLFYSSTAVRLDGEMKEIQYRERLQPWTLHLTSALGEPLAGDIQCRVKRDGKEMKAFTLKSEEKRIPEALMDLPSGAYELEATVDLKGDTASMHRKFLLVSMEDASPADDSALWLDAADDKFGPDQKARIQVGSALKDAWIWLTVPAWDHLAVDTLIHVSNALTTVEIPYEEGFGNGTEVLANLYSNGRMHMLRLSLRVEKPDIALRPRWDTFRDHLRPGQKEEWKLSLRNPDGSPASANVLLGLYDASLDALRPHQIRYSRLLKYHLPDLMVEGSNQWADREVLYLPMNIRYKPLRDLDFSDWNADVLLGVGGRPMKTRTTRAMLKEVAVPRVTANAPRMYAALASDVSESVSMKALSGKIAGLDQADEADSDGRSSQDEPDEPEESANMVALRENMQETAFFYPTLRTDEQGQVNVVFTLPEALTSWHLQGFAHTSDLMYVNLEENIVAQKDLMAEISLPRFFRDGDQGILRASVRNLSNKHQSGICMLNVRDAETEKVLAKKQMTFDLEPQGVAYYDLDCPASSNHPLMVVQWSARSQETSDGEQRYLPVLSRMQPVTDTKAFSLTGKQEGIIALDKLFASDNAQAQNRILTVEYTRNPQWLALMALPSLARPRCEDILSLTSAYYASSLAYYISHRYPAMPQCVNRWAKENEESTLEKNQQLADLLLQETPWMQESEAEKERHQRLVALFDENEQNAHRTHLLNRLKLLQNSDGAFSWYPGMQASPYLTREVAYQLSRLQKMTADSLATPQNHEARVILYKAIGYLQNEVARQVEQMRQRKESWIGLSTLRYLYLLKESGYQASDRIKDDAAYLVDQLRKQAAGYEVEEKALAALVLQQYGEEKLARELMAQLKPRITREDGVYVAYPRGRFMPIDRKMQTHVQIMEAWARIMPGEKNMLEKMQQWILQQKRTQEWEQPVQTANAVYALTTLLPSATEEKGTDMLLIKDGHQARLLDSPETEEGYVRARLEDLKSPKQLVVHKSGSGTSWGAVYAQYQIPQDQMEAQGEGMTVRCDVPDGVWKLGDRVHVRYTLTMDKDYEYLCLHADRPSLTEPSNQISGYRYLGGVGCYRAVHDASTDYYFDRLPRGTYVIEEDWIVSYTGSCGVAGASLKSLYAPEYQAHSQGRNLIVK